MKMELKNIRSKIIIVIILLLSLVTIASCKKNDKKEKPHIENNNIFPSEFVNITKNKKVYLTSFGQSKEVEDLGLFLYKSQKIDYVQDNKLEIEDVEENAIVFAVVGCSIKGLEAQNTTKAKEIERCKKFVTAKTEGKITLITWHLGGMSRRGTTSDEIISVALAGSNFSIYVVSGNEDGYLSTILSENGISYYSITNITQLEKPINYLFGFSSEE